jgi:N-acetylmuramoyl-L-alanine amidase
MKIEAHRLIDETGAAVKFRETPNCGGQLNPSVLVIHYTAGHSADNAITWLCSRTAKASAHLVIGADGSITQLVPFNVISWHAGPSRWNDRERLNQWSIGIELDNPGFLTRTGNVWRTRLGREIPDNEVMVAAHKHGGREMGWKIYPEAQLEVLERVATALFEAYPLKEIIGHDDIAPRRKRDPGPAFPMSHFRSRVVGRTDDAPASNQLFVTTEVLNLRSQPSSQSEKLSELPPNTRLEVLERSGKWCRVEVLDTVHGDADLDGWVHGGFIKLAAPH